MVFPSIRSFQEISLTNDSQDYLESRDNIKPTPKVYKPLKNRSKSFSKKRLRKLIAKNTRTFEYPLAS